MDHPKIELSDGIETKGKFRLSDLLKIALAVVLFVFVFSKTSWQDLYALRHSISVPWLIVAMLFYYLQSLVMAYRYWILLGRKIPLREIFNLTILQIVVGNLVATSAGAVSYVAILRSKYRIQIVSGIGSILLARFGDLILLLFAFVLSGMILRTHLLEIKLLIEALAIILIGLISLVVMLVIFRLRFVLAMEKFFHLTKLDRLEVLRKGEQYIQALAIRGLRDLSVLFWPMLATTLLIYLINFLYLSSSYRAFGLSVGCWIILFMIASLNLLGIIPIQILGGLGVTEITGVYLLSLFGFSQGEVAPVMIGLRIVFVLFNLVLVVHLFLETWLTPKFSNSSN